MNCLPPKKTLAGSTDKQCVKRLCERSLNLAQTVLRVPSATAAGGRLAFEIEDSRSTLRPSSSTNCRLALCSQPATRTPSGEKPATASQARRRTALPNVPYGTASALSSSTRSRPSSSVPLLDLHQLRVDLPLTRRHPSSKGLVPGMRRLARILRRPKSGIA
jgi:hypothetical protein